MTDYKSSNAIRSLQALTLKYVGQEISDEDAARFVADLEIQAKALNGAEAKLCPVAPEGKVIGFKLEKV